MHTCACLLAVHQTPVWVDARGAPVLAAGVGGPGGQHRGRGRAAGQGAGVAQAACTPTCACMPAGAWPVLGGSVIATVGVAAQQQLLKGT